MNYPARFKAKNQRFDTSFTLGLGAAVALWAIGDLMGIHEKGILSWWFLLFVVIGTVIFMIGGRLAERRAYRLAEAQCNDAYAEGYQTAIKDVLDSMDRHNGNWGRP